MPSITTARRALVALLAAAAGLAIPAQAAPAATSDLPDGPALARNLVRKVTIDGINRHLIAMQRFADRTGGNRAAGTPGHVQSAEYIATKLEAAGYLVTRQEFPFTFFKPLAEKLTVGSANVPITMVLYSPSTPVGGVTTPLAVLPAGHETGCTAADYAGVDVAGKVVLIKRGPAGCTFAGKARVAQQAGAVATIVYNNVPGPVLRVTLQDPANGTIPIGVISDTDGAALIAQTGTATKLELRADIHPATSYNVIAETQTGRHDNVVMAGAQLDTITESPGINDNASGNATLLEIALQLGGTPRVNNAIRFAWWSAGEVGLIGSTFYVNSLDFEEQLNIALYLNFDIIGSPNAARFVFDGDNSDAIGAGPGPFGSAQIEAAFQGFLSATGVETEGTDFDGRSDYRDFMLQGIPAGGLYTGSQEIKTPAQAAKWGGVAGLASDPCSDKPCDTLANVDRTVLDSNADATAFVLASYGISTEDINGITPDADAKTLAKSKASSAAARYTAISRIRTAGANARESSAS